MTTFHLPGMRCGGCARRITQALKALDPQCRVEIDLPTHTVRVQSQEDPKDLAQALRDAGYPPA